MNTEWVAISFSRGSSQPRGWTHISYVSCISRQVLYHQHHLGSPSFPSSMLKSRTVSSSFSDGRRGKRRGHGCAYSPLQGHLKKVTFFWGQRTQHSLRRQEADTVWLCATTLIFLRSWRPANVQRQHEGQNGTLPSLCASTRPATSQCEWNLTVTVTASLPHPATSQCEEAPTVIFVVVQTSFVLLSQVVAWLKPSLSWGVKRGCMRPILKATQSGRRAPVKGTHPGPKLRQLGPARWGLSLKSARPSAAPPHSIGSGIKAENER